MKHFGWTAAEVIGWMRVCRPGMVIGPQQHWMERQQDIQWRAGDAYRAKKQRQSGGSGEMTPQGILSFRPQDMGNAAGGGQAA